MTPTPTSALPDGRIAFIGLGNMGGGMAANQARAGHAVAAFDLSPSALERAASVGCAPVGSVAEAVKDAGFQETMRKSYTSIEYLGPAQYRAALAERERDWQRHLGNPKFRELLQ